MVKTIAKLAIPFTFVEEGTYPIMIDGKTPAEAANIKIEGTNKSMTIIQNAAHEIQQT